MLFDVLKQEYLDGICSIEQHSFSHPWSRYAFERELENSVAEYTVAVDNGKVVAYGGLWHILDEGHITNIAVHKDHRRQGIADALLAKMLKNGRENGINAFTLEVRVSNLGAQALYKKHGFECAGVRKGYYPDGEDAMIFWLDLNGGER